MDYYHKDHTLVENIEHTLPNGDLHKMQFSNGVLIGEAWTRNGELHREDGPAYCAYTTNLIEYWLLGHYVAGRHKRLISFSEEEKIMNKLRTGNIYGL